MGYCFTKNAEKCKIIFEKERKVEKQNFNTKFKILFAYCLIAIMLLSCSFVLFTSSWLTTSDNSAMTDDLSVLPTTGLEFYNKTTKLEGPLAFTTDNVNTPTELQIYVKNTGNARAIVRLFYAFYVDTEMKEIATTNHFSSVSYGNYWLTHEHLPNTYSGYLFFDGAIEPNSYVQLFNSVTATSDWANKVVTLHITGESVLYDGNAYTVGATDKYPWPSYPEQWLNILYELNNNPGVSGPKEGDTYGFYEPTGMPIEVVEDTSSPTGEAIEWIGTGDFDDATSYNRIMSYDSIYAVKGETYVCSMLYKCDNWVYPSSVYGDPLYYQVYGGDYSWEQEHGIVYENIGEYQFLKTETPKLTSDTNLWIFSGVPAKGYTARVCNIYVTRVCGSASI